MQEEIDWKLEKADKKKLEQYLFIFGVIAITILIICSLIIANKYNILVVEHNQLLKDCAERVWLIK